MEAVGAFAERVETRSAALEEYSDPGGVGDLVRAALVVNAIAGLVSAGFAVSYLTALRGGSVSALTAAGDRLSMGDALTLSAWLVCAAAFVVWTQRVYRNLAPLGARDLRFGTGWAIGGWFVPILALWRPKQILNDVWRASDRELPEHAARSDWADRAPPFAMALWWGAWIVSIVAERISVRLDNDPSVAVDTTMAFRIAGGVTAAAGALLGLWVVGMLTRRQRERAARLREINGSVALAAPFGVSPERPVLPQHSPAP